MERGIKMKVYYSERDNAILKKYLQKKEGLELYTFSKEEKNLASFIKNLKKRNIDVVVQIAPQWEWGSQVEDISKAIMDEGIKLLSGEGAMFRWFGEDELCGSEIGFYLSPWGFSGNSKIAYELPKPLESDIIIAERIRANLRRWNPKHNNGKILIVGQLDKDKSRYFAQGISTNEELINECIKIFGKKRVVFRKHPKDQNAYNLGIITATSVKKLKDIIPDYYACVSINSTSSIEAMCAGTPIINTGVSPWSGAGRLIQKLNQPIIEYDYNEYLNILASLIHLHYLPTFSHGDPLNRALKFYTQHDSQIFLFNCKQFQDPPKTWENEYIY